MLCFFGSCHPETSNGSGTEVIELKKYETIYALEESQFDSTTLISPTIITYDGKSNLFVIETTFLQLCDQMILTHNYAKTFIGLSTRIITKVASVPLLQYKNVQKNQPINHTKHALAVYS